MEHKSARSGFAHKSLDKSFGSVSRLQDAENNYNSAQMLFDDISVRKQFIRKVYLILMAQLLVTFGFVAIFVFNQTMQDFAFAHPGLFWLAFFVLLVTMLTMACCDDVRRQTPMNYIFLGIFTLAESFLLGVVTSPFEPQIILMAVAASAVICLALSLYAFQSRYDFTVMGGLLLVTVIAFLFFGILAVFFPGRIMLLVYNGLGCIIFSFYLIYDTQLMMGGSHRYSLSPEEYVFAALNLYLDVINIFLHVMSLIASGKN